MNGDRLPGPSGAQSEVATHGFLSEPRIHCVPATTPPSEAILENRSELTDEDLLGFYRVGWRRDDWRLLPGNSRTGSSRSADNVRRVQQAAVDATARKTNGTIDETSHAAGEYSQGATRRSPNYHHVESRRA